MPELPEVETIRLGLQRLLPGRIIASVTSDWHKSFPNAQADVDAFLLGASVVAIRRRAKVLLVDLSTHYTLVIHLKMTGQLVFVAKPHQQGTGVGKWEVGQRIESNNIYQDGPLPITHYPIPPADGRFGAGHPNDSLTGALPDKSTRVTLTYTDGSKLFFNDQRKFGWMRLMPTVEVSNIDFMRKLGPEPLEADFTDTLFVQRLLRRPKSNIKAVLLDQTVLAGVGNIYADESLFAAKIHPASIVSAIPVSQLKLLHKELIAVLRLSIEKGGSTDKNYVNAEGKKGSYIDFAKVFRRNGQPCTVCGREIVKLRVAGRGTHVCERCQRRYEVQP